MHAYQVRDISERRRRKARERRHSSNTHTHTRAIETKDLDAFDAALEGGSIEACLDQVLLALLERTATSLSCVTNPIESNRIESNRIESDSGSP